MSYVEVAHLRHVLPDGRVLLDDVNLRVGDGDVAALVGANGTGKTTLLRLIAGDLVPQAGTVSRDGGLGVMRQFIGSVRDDTSVRDLLLSLAPPAVAAAAADLEAAELAMMEADDEATQLRYASALVAWGDAGGYDADVLWDTCTVAALGLPLSGCQYRPVATLSGGEQKRLALEALLRGPQQVLLLDEPDNYLDVPGKTWLEGQLAATRKTVLLVSHDRELLHRAATRVITLEGHGAWVHGGGFATYADARRHRLERLEEVHRRWAEEHTRLRHLVVTLRQQASISPDMASRYRAMVTRLERFEAAGPPPERPREQQITMRLRGGRTGLRVARLDAVTLPGLVEQPISVEIFFGERVGLLGANGSGKSHLLRLLAGEQVVHTGTVTRGARVVPGLFAQTHEHPDLEDRTLVEILHRAGKDRGAAIAALRRYELHAAADQTFGQLSGGQQARVQVLLLELAGATLLLLDEPTDNLDVDSAEALQAGLEQFEGTVVAVTHDRWFARTLDRFLLMRADGTVTETAEPVFDEARAART